jgi:hypothetical protein
MSADSLKRKRSDSSDSMLLDLTQPPNISPVAEAITPKMLKHRAEDLKVEGPLTPPIFSDSPMKKLKSVSFADALHLFIPEAPWAKALTEQWEDDSNPDFDELFKDIGPYIRDATRKAENEKLSGVDTTARMGLPDVDFTLPVAPWKEYSLIKGGKRKSGETELSAQMKFLLRVKREDLKAASSWHGLSGLERTLKWNIFTTNISKIDLEERLHGEAGLNQMLAEFSNGNIATSCSQVWKLEGLQILLADTDEDEIELADFEECSDIEGLIRKRKLELEEETPRAHHKSKGTVPHSATYPQAQPLNETLESFSMSKSAPSIHNSANIHFEPANCDKSGSQAATSTREPLHLTENTSNGLMFGGFSATTALQKFMETRGRAAAPVNREAANSNPSPKSFDRPASGTEVVRSRESRPGQLSGLPKQPAALSASMNHVHQVAPPSLPRLPVLPTNLAPCSFIISSKFLQRRHLIKQLEHLYEQAEMIYRDYDRPHSPAKEADILLSPSTGLMLTTLQQIKQRPLPGQPDRSPVEERVTKLQLRYERLVVLIHEGLSDEMERQGSSRPEDTRDKEVLSRFERFSSYFEGEVLVKYIPGGEKALAYSLVLEMAHYGLPHGSRDIGDIKPMASETTVSARVPGLPNMRLS